MKRDKEFKLPAGYEFPPDWYQGQVLTSALRFNPTLTYAPGLEADTSLASDKTSGVIKYLVWGNMALPVQQTTS